MNSSVYNRYIIVWFLAKQHVAHGNAGFIMGAKWLRREYGNIGCIPSACRLVKMAGTKIIADDYNYALAA